MTDAEIIKALEWCSDDSSDYCCELGQGCTDGSCMNKLMKAALDLIQRQQAKIDELKDREARFAFDRIHYNIKELNLIQEGHNISELKKRFRAEFKEKMELGIADCINWADWLDSIASELLGRVKVGGSDDR